MEDNNFYKIINEIGLQFENIHYKGDLSDLGNEIGIVLGKYIKNEKEGLKLEDFIHGIKHGISLSNGTH